MTKFTRYTVNNERQKFQQETIWKKFKVGAISIRIVIFGLIIMVGLVYLIQTNQVSTGGFEIKELNKKVEQLQKDNKKLELETTKLQSLKTIKAATENMDLVSVSKIDYITLPPSAVALSE
ncbi:MAG: hypothetical protein COY66_00480 [Candidatus Kerfeldbacteria bacterium CG_4_10_14_0_8_um_filter_42_10]|uniref:Cell division protein FtsL n=1 Tax=Candidatus Kerfeldbacteria bacterium CG_4_10_14_0_8_um_filter_42_10 TaxID=2014248 RepID=A0A2M7RLC1_9BACT|nr:MAG: hypothetical protein COY66_00480 [Candidatus Kerfeldbacteria bacterium CG_4_10_14_0_8_um_filter_42_10]